MGLADAVMAGERLALSRLLTQVENDTPVGREALDQLFPYTGKAHLIGFTGSPGTGKSSLVNQVARLLRRREGGAEQRVAIVAVDPSSPFTGGALLGDRVRMRDLSGDPGVFIRSMASRGTLGGLARSTAAVVQVLDAAGFERILIETVGAGQSEIDIARLAHTTVVVEAPGMGDDIQAIKAGILEIADILVVNKADRAGVENTERALRTMLEMASIRPSRRSGTTAWEIPLLKTTATLAEGIAPVAEAIWRHEQYLRDSGEWQQRDQQRLESELILLLRETLLARWQDRRPEDEYRRMVQNLVERKISPTQAVDRLLRPGP